MRGLSSPRSVQVDVHLSGYHARCWTLGTCSSSNIGALLSSASLRELPFLFVFYSIPRLSLSVEYPFATATLLRVCPVPFLPFLQLITTLFYLTNLLAIYILFLFFYGESDCHSSSDGYKLDYYTPCLYFNDHYFRFACFVFIGLIFARTSHSASPNSWTPRTNIVFDSCCGEFCHYLYNIA